jgi:prepilin-type processing-associated H-X9-DG protein
MKCANNLKQIGLACHNYHDSESGLPAGEYRTTRFSHLSKLLPYVEQHAVHASIDFNQPVTHANNSQARTATISTFVCPSDRANPMPSVGTATNYYGNKGSELPWYDASGPNAGLPPPNGVFFLESRVKFGDILDGLSNTAFFSERVLADGSNGIVSPLEDLFFPKTSPTTLDEAVADCRNLDISDPANQVPVFFGAPYLDGQHCYQHVSTPNGRSCGFFIVNRGVVPPSSRHPQGVNVVMGDGSVRFFANSVELGVWRGLGSRAGGEIVTP